ncbi:metallophosphoesterase family protein [Blautia sp. MSJ-19]|uniref:metallophosphoesterase family protein n=1 Tax=Blautia sp. MSJ-19 TaxID=2841517 RepID=UPI001C0EAB48|nr:metallophosphoesterase [Blautia sp. MSJ-19]MBU5481000.1 metallophosphoesterase [Blautia sp. MSJ-19]
MKVLIVSDTHGRDENLERAVMLETPFDMLAHCGDVEGREIFIEALAECPCCIVSGNNDFFSDLPREDVIEIEGKRVLVTHGHYYGVSMDISGVAEEAKARECDMVFFGHTHKPVIEEIDGILAVNPGSLSYPRQRGRKPSYAVLETAPGGEMTVEIRYL